MQELAASQTVLVGIKSKIRLKKSWQEAIWLFLFFAVLSIGILSPISATSSIPNLADYINHLSAIIQAKTALMQGQFPLRTMPYEMDKLGYPLYQFYSPTSFTFIGLIYWLLTPDNPIVAINIALWCSLMFGGLSMYGLAYWFIRSKPAAILAGVVYMYAPYYIVIVDHFGSFQEIFALSVLPAIFYLTLHQFYFPDKLKTALLLSAGLYVFFTLHLPTAIYATTLFAILLMTLTYQNHKRIRNLFLISFTYLFAGLLAAWYLIPAVIFQKYFVISNTYSNADHLTLYHLTLANLLFPAASVAAGIQANGLSAIHPSLGLPIIVGIGICVFAFFNKLSSGQRRADYLMPGLLLLFCIAFLLAWSPINFWRFLPQPLLVAQYCWRLLGQVIWLGALLFSWAIYWLFKGKLETKQVLLISILIILCANPWFKNAENWEVRLADFLQNPHLIYNKDAVTINYNNYPQLVTNIDSVQVDANQTLRVNAPYHIPASLIKFATKPNIVIQGVAPANVDLTALVNNVPVANKTLTAGEFSWNIPLSFAKDQTTTILEFIAKDKSFATDMPLSEFVLTGFLATDETYNLLQIAPFCQQHNTAKVCDVTVPEKIKILELPQLYYPKMLEVTLNGKTVPYQSVIYHGHLITSITPETGQPSHITIEFKGLAMANAISWLAWAAWLLLLAKLGIEQYRKKGLAE